MPNPSFNFRENSSIALPSGTTIRTIGLVGSGRSWSNTASRLRGWKLPAEEDSSAQLLAAMEAFDIHEQETIHLDLDRAVAGADTVVLEPPLPPPNAVQVVLYQDEAGVISWHLPDGRLLPDSAEPPGARLRSRGLRCTFTISTRSAGAREALRMEPASSRLRGFITGLGRKVFKVLVLPLVSEWLGEPLRKLAENIESRYRQEIIRPLAAANYRRSIVDEFTDWGALRTKRCLLVVHGIFSTTERTLSQFPEDAMRALEAHYEGRMIALDQLTVSRSPEDNARNFLQKAKAALGGSTVEFDILCHSRGGIVSRALVERGEALVSGHPCRFRKVFFAAAPNRGSLLADPDHIVDMIDAFTNLATEFPDCWATYALELLLGLVKLLVHSSERYLPGVAAMSTLPGQYISAGLNAVSPSGGEPVCDYAATASDFNPSIESGLSWRLANILVDRIFHTARGAIPNDLVVPCNGVFESNGHPWFPIEKRLVFERQHGVKHTDFFAQRAVISAIKWHFGLAGAEPPDGMVLPPRDAARLRGRERADSIEAREVESGTALTEVLRKPEIAYHEYIEAGRTDVLTVSLAALTVEDLGAVQALRIALGAEGGAMLSVALSAPGFDIVGADTLPLAVHNRPVGSPETVIFSITPRDPGPVPIVKELRAVFWQGTTLLGSVSHFTVVAPVGWANATPPGGGEQFDTGVHFSSGPRRDCELVLSVEGNESDGVSPFKLSLRSSIPRESYESRRGGKYYSPQGQESLEKYLADFFGGQFRTYPSDSLSDEGFARALPRWEQDFVAALNDLGRTLWDWLPSEFRGEYLRLLKVGAAPQSILIASEEMVLPWELVVPRDDEGNNLVPLGQAHVIGRWHPSWRKKPNPQRLRVRAGCLLSPNYAGRRRLRQADREVAAVQSLLPRVQLNPGSDLPTVRREVLGATDLQLLHFIGHGEFNMENADESALVLADEALLKARAFNGSALAGKASPVLYLNACGVGQNALVVGRPGGFCANFVRSGGTGVIAPYWPVNDTEAARFAQELYQKLLRNRSVGEALRELRADNPDNSTFQAFAWFGDPWASLNLEDLVGWTERRQTGSVSPRPASPGSACR